MKSFSVEDINYRLNLSLCIASIIESFYFSKNN